MAPYKNDYSKEEDPMMWQLHENRHSLSKRFKTAEQIHAEGKKVLDKFGLTNLRTYSCK